MPSSIISHEIFSEPVSVSPVESVKDRIRKTSDLALPLNESLALVDQLSQSAFGRYLLRHRGLNGRWTRYLTMFPDQGEITGLNDEGKPIGDLERWLLTYPVARATQERFKIFRREIEKRLHSKMVLASLPCGLMDDLMRIDYSSVKDIKLVGIDLDEESLAELRRCPNPSPNVKLGIRREDAWHLPVAGEFDLLTSHGLNIYESNSDRVFELYQQFARGLKSGGYLVTSFMTPTPPAKDSPWSEIAPDVLVRMRALFDQIIQVKWGAGRTEEKTRAQLTKAGFVVEEVIYDKAHIFPTVIAKKK